MTEKTYRTLASCLERYSKEWEDTSFLQELHEKADMMVDEVLSTIEKENLLRDATTDDVEELYAVIKNACLDTIVKKIRYENIFKN